MKEPKIIKIFGDKLNKVDLSPQEERDILSIRDIIGYNNLNLQADGRLLVSHYVGFIQINKTRLLIYPKITNRTTTEPGFDRSFTILIKLLSYSGFMNIKNTPSPQDTGKYEGDLLEIFIGIFIDELLNHFRRDINRNYNENIENQIFIKGKIDFSETIKKNSYRKHLHCVRFEHFTEDNPLNQIFKAVIKGLITITTLKENKLKLRQGLLWLEDVKEIEIRSESWDRVRFTRLNNHYKPLFNLARLFYYNSSPSLNRGKDYVFSFLLPLNQLYEEYLYKLIKNNSIDDLLVSSQGPSKFLGKRNSNGYGLLKPDIVISKDNEVKCIMDAKFKEITDINKNLNIIPADIYQMLAYGIRYNCNKIALVYPRYLEDVEDEMLITEIHIDNIGERICIKILKIDLEAEEKLLANELYDNIGY